MFFPGCACSLPVSFLLSSYDVPMFLSGSSHTGELEWMGVERWCVGVSGRERMCQAMVVDHSNPTGDAQGVLCVSDAYRKAKRERGHRCRSSLVLVRAEREDAPCIGECFSSLCLALLVVAPWCILMGNGSEGYCEPAI